MCIPLDASFVPVDMGMGTACQRNDDSSGLYTLNGWSYDHFGTLYNSVYINNNGNLSFGVPYYTFSPVGFPVAGFPMVAPFWGDVDTRDVGGSLGGTVWVREESVAGGDAVNRLTVIWDHVGYFNVNDDRLNTFEVILTDGNDPLVGLGINTCFCYDNMDWTTGDASSGSGGFGGSPATVGANQGNGVDFFQIGLFDHPGVDYDGPGGATDGVDFLDNTTFWFDLSGSDPNTPPVWLNPPSDCLTVTEGQLLVFSVQAIGPENGETVTIVEDHGTLANYSCTLTPGNPATADCSFLPASNQVGFHNVTFTATDNGTPPLSTPINVCIEVVPDPLAVDVQYFRARRVSSNGMLLFWGTASEVENAGFEIYRRPWVTNAPEDLPGNAVQVTPNLIPARGAPFQSTAYRWVDGTAAQGQAFNYWLVDVDLHGESTTHGPIEVR